MKTSQQFHTDAMYLYEESLVAKFHKNDRLRQLLLSKAFELEKEAGLLLRNRLDLEPTRSNVFMSAAYMAVQLRSYIDCFEMIKYMMEGSPKLYKVKEAIDLLIWIKIELS